MAHSPDASEAKQPRFIELEQFIKNYLGNVYVTTEEHDRLIAAHRAMSWKEASDAEKRRDGVLPEESSSDETDYASEEV